MKDGIISTYTDLYQRADAEQFEKERRNPRYWERREQAKIPPITPEQADRWLKNASLPVTTEAERQAFLATIQFDRLTPAEVDDAARLDEIKRKHGREPHEL